MAPIPKKALLIISIGDTPPDLIVYNDLKVFRCALNFVSTACSRTHIGSVRLSIFVRDSKLIFECKDSAPDVTESDSSHLFRSENAENMQESAFADLHLSAYTIASMGGEYGFQPYNFADDELLQSEDRCKNGSLFWFNVPLGVQASKEDRVMPASPSTSVSVEVTATKIPVFATSLVNHPQKLVPSPIDKGQSDSAASISRGSAEMTRDRDLPRGGTTIEHCTTSFNTTKSKLSVEAIPQNVSGPLQSRQRKALVIDDSLVVRKTLARALSGMGYACTVAENGMEGLKELQDTIFDLSLCDFFMPVMDGLDCVKQYREWEQQHRPWFRQHIVGISAHASGNDAVVGAKLGLDDFKSKPVTIKTLKELGESQQVSVIAHHLDALASNHNSDETTAVISTDKTSISSQPSSSDGSENYVPICLIASLDFGDNTASIFKSNGWKCEVVRDCGGAMKLLKMRNWDAVLLDEALLPTSASHCTREFRQWEAENRVNRQNNLFLLCSMCAIDSNESVVVQAPCGFDGVICRRLRWDEFETMVLKNNGNEYPSPTSIITR
jgi:CheY-like chemotaxis protein